MSELHESSTVQVDDEIILSDVDSSDGLSTDFPTFGLGHLTEKSQTDTQAVVDVHDNNETDVLSSSFVENISSELTIDRDNAMTSIPTEGGVDCVSESDNGNKEDIPRQVCDVVENHSAEPITDSFDPEIEAAVKVADVKDGAGDNIKQHQAGELEKIAAKVIPYSSCNSAKVVTSILSKGDLQTDLIEDKSTNVADDTDSNSENDVINVVKDNEGVSEIFKDRDVTEFLSQSVAASEHVPADNHSKSISDDLISDSSCNLTGTGKIEELQTLDTADIDEPADNFEETGLSVIEELKLIRDELANKCSNTDISSSVDAESLVISDDAQSRPHCEILINATCDTDRHTITTYNDISDNILESKIVHTDIPVPASQEVSDLADTVDKVPEVDGDANVLVDYGDNNTGDDDSLLDDHEVIGLDSLFKEETVSKASKAAPSKPRRSKSAMKRKVQQQKLQRVIARSTTSNNSRKKYALSFHELSRPLFSNDVMDVDPTFTCSVCLDMFHLPTRCHPCSHMFCDPCLRHLTNMGSEGVHCPLCRTVIQTCHLDTELDEKLMCTYPQVYTARSMAERHNKHRFDRLPYTPPVPLGKKLLRKLAASRLYQSETRWMSHDWVKFLLGCMAGVFVTTMLMMFNRVRSISDARDVNIMFLSLLTGAALTFVIFKVVKI